MDKAEYRVKLEEINELAEQGRFSEAAEAAHDVDWRHVKSVRTLSMIGEIYEANKEYEESRTILKYAYKRAGTSKTVLYRLAELDIRTGYFEEAKKYINEFEQLSPNDTSRYILKYKLLRAKKASYDDQIEVLRNYKDTEYSERWAYELAKLYKKNDQNEKCIEECDDMILWFSEGKYVKKAMELKMTLTELTPSQQAIYDTIKNGTPAVERNLAEPAEGENSDIPEIEPDAMDAAAKAVAEIEDEDEDTLTKVSAGESFEMFESAAEHAVAETGTVAEEVEEKEAEIVEDPEFDAKYLGETESEAEDEDEEAEQEITEKVEIPESLPDKIQGKISKGIQTMFAGIKKPTFAFLKKSEGEAVESETAEEAVEEAEVSETAADEIPVEEEASDIFDELKEAGEFAAQEVSGQDIFENEAAPETEADEVPAEEVPEEAAESMTAEEISEETASAEEAEAEVVSEDVDSTADDDCLDDDMKIVDLKEDPFDLDLLFAETAGALTTEVASGGYVFADTLESDRQSAEEAASRKRAERTMQISDEEQILVMDEAAEAAEEVVETVQDPEMVSLLSSLEDAMNEMDIPDLDEEDEKEAEDFLAAVEASMDAENAAAERAEAESSEAESPEAAEENSDTVEAENSLYAKETDESLGLTREFHLRDELERLLHGRRRKQKTEETVTAATEAEDISVVVDEAGAAEAPAERSELIRPEEAAAKTLAEAGIGSDSDEEIDLKKLSEDESVIRELLADEEEIPQEDSTEMVLELSQIEETAQEDEPDMIDNIVIEPDYLERIPVEGRALTTAEKKALSYFGKIPGIDYQITSAIADIHNNSGDKTSRSGNVLIMGRQGSGKTRLADGLVLAVCMDLGMKAVRSAKVIADHLNDKDPAAVIKKLAGGFLIIEAAGSLSDEAVERLNYAMKYRTDSLVVILEDEKADLQAMLMKHPEFASRFTSRITVPVFTNDELVAFGGIYASEEGYRLDDMATLALYTMIGENQKDSEPITVGRVKAMVDRAIDRHSRKFRFGKAERDGGRVVLHEKDFNF